MWRLTAALAAAGCILVAGGCRGRKQSPAAEAARLSLASTISVADPQYAPQLVRGFYAVESSWRWTQKSFAVNLAAPNGAAQHGAELHLRFGIPEPLINNLKSIGVSAAINGLSLPKERYDKAGQFTYTRDIPPERLRTGTIPVEFALDQALPPGEADKRELGIVAIEVGLVAKQ